MEESKSETTIILMLIENQNNLNKDLESNSTQKFEGVTRKSNRKQSIHKTDGIKFSNRYETHDNNDKSFNSYDSSTSSDSGTSSD